jgi:hypothetical protein
MAIAQGLCSSFKLESWQAIHNLSTDVLKLALYKSTADINASTTVYTTTNEVVGAGYTAGGVTLAGQSLVLNSGIAYLTFNNPAWTGASFVTRAALIYNSTKANRAIAVLDFGADKTASGNFTIQLPPAGPTTAVIRME